MITIVIVHHRGRVLPTSKMIMIVILHRGHVLSRHVDQEDEEKGEDGVAGGENQSRKKLHFFGLGFCKVTEDVIYIGTPTSRLTHNP